MERMHGRISRRIRQPKLLPVGETEYLVNGLTWFRSTGLDQPGAQRIRLRSNGNGEAKAGAVRLIVRLCGQPEADHPR